jgi:hypothetical protein
MADEIYGGDILSYTVTGFGAPLPGTWEAIRQAVVSRSGSFGSVIDSAAGDYSFSVRLRSNVNRARMADLKGDLDRITDSVTGQDHSSVLDFYSQVPRMNMPIIPGVTPNVPPPPPGAQPSFIAGLAKSLGVSESNAWLILLGGIGAVVLMMKK